MSRPRTALVAVVAAAVALVLAGCASPGDPPVAVLGPPAGPVETPTGGSGVVPAGDGVDPAAGVAAGVGPDICDLARDPEVMADVERWAAYVPALEASVPADVDVAAALGGLTPDTPASPTVVTGLDAVWDLVDERCAQDPLVEQCRNLIAIALADPVGWAVRAPDAAEVEAAFRLATDNWSDLRQRVAGDELRRAADANLAFLADAGELLTAVGWAPGRLDVLEPLADQLVALGAPEVIEPLRQLEVDCGFA